LRTGEPLSVELGPGILETIFDGIQRPLKEIAVRANQSVFIPRGIELPCLDQDKEWYFEPVTSLKKGSLIVGGDIIGVVNENTLF
jgi:vacuolar-type H+-ATPase catalytic subunit A/Vma1